MPVSSIKQIRFWRQARVSKAFHMFVIAIVTALAGELKINPFDGDLFRLGLGTSAFLTCLLLMPNLSYFRTGLMTSIVVLLFRIGLDAADYSEPFSFLSSLTSHLAGGSFYFAFAFGMSLIQNKMNTLQPLILGGFVSAIDFISNQLERLVREATTGFVPFTMNGLFLLAGVAVIRTYFVIGIISSISVRQMRLTQAEQQKRIEQMLQIGSGLYGESFYLQKVMETIEKVMASSFELYSNLKSERHIQHSQHALEISQQIHEVKKDSQRIQAGLLKLYDRQIVAEMSLANVMRYVMKANQTYGEMLHKKITIHGELGTDYGTTHYIILLSVLNNLVANAVEAIEVEGEVRIAVCEVGEQTVFTVMDSGKGVPEQDRMIIFEPGYTTKFNQIGVAATGIGLSHVRDIVESFGGTIQLSTPLNRKGTQFDVSLPTIALRR